METKKFILYLNKRSIFVERREEDPEAGSIKIHTPQGDSILQVNNDIDYYINTLYDYMESNPIPCSIKAIEEVIYKLFF